MLNITLVLGTARKDRESEKVATYLKECFGEQSGVNLTYVDVRDHVASPETVPPWGIGGTKKTPSAWQEIAQGTDAFVFVLPEYNHGYPGEWKLLVDSLYSEYAGKHVYVVGVSDGDFAGVRVADHVKPILVELKLVLHKTALYVPRVDEAFDERGVPKGTVLKERVEAFIDSVLKLT